MVKESTCQEMQETWVRSLGGEDPMGKEVATHSSILPWKIPWTDEPGRLQSMEFKESDTTEHACTHRLINCNNLSMCIYVDVCV